MLFGLVDLDTASAQVLQNLRHQKGLTQEELSEKAGLDVTSISRFERGVRKPSIESLFLIARALRISPKTIIAEIEKLKPKLSND